MVVVVLRRSYRGGYGWIWEVPGVVVRFLAVVQRGIGNKWVSLVLVVGICGLGD